MPVKTIWPIDHACGHTTQADLSARPAGYARWLASRDCSECWRASRDGDSESKAEWPANKRAEEAAEAEKWAEQYRMPPLDGSERAVGWATRCRHQLVTAAYTALVLEGEMDEAEWEAIEEAVRPLTRAGWWIDNRDADPTDLPELLEAACGTDRPSENPPLLRGPSQCLSLPISPLPASTTPMSLSPKPWMTAPSSSSRTSDSTAISDSAGAGTGYRAP